MTLSDDKKAAIFKRLASGTLYDVGVEFGLDKHYSTLDAVKSKVYKVYREVANDPEKFAIQPETVEVVMGAVSNRQISTHKSASLAEKQTGIKEKDIKDLVISGRNTAGSLIHKKLEWLDKNPAELKKESLVNLGKIFGILFDKGQIIQGQATEHVAVMSKINDNLTPEEALDAVLRSREVSQAEKHG